MAEKISVSFQNGKTTNFELVGQPQKFTSEAELAKLVVEGKGQKYLLLARNGAGKVLAQSLLEYDGRSTVRMIREDTGLPDPLTSFSVATLAESLTKEVANSSQSPFKDNGSITLQKINEVESFSGDATSPSTSQPPSEPTSYLPWIIGGAAVVLILMASRNRSGEAT